MSIFSSSHTFLDDPGHNEKTKALAKKYFPTPKKIGKFKIDGFYAQGGMSMLYLATDPSTEEQIIIKVLQPKLLLDKESVSEFLNEAHIISSIHHPNIVKLYEYGEWENGLYIAMEFIQGQSLLQILKNNPLPLKRAIDVLIQISYALFHLHTCNIVHGDIKPENILITDQGQIKLLDFGISQLLSHAQLENKNRGIVKGTPIYMSPELHIDSKKQSFQSDIYSLGIVAYEIVLGRITHGKVLLHLAPKGLQKILNRALKPNPEERYRSVIELIEDLTQYANSGRIAKDRQGVDYFFELFDQLETELQKMIKSHAPKKMQKWSIGICPSFGVGLKGLYYSLEESSYKDNFNNTDTPSSLLFLALTTQSQGAEGVLDVFQIDAIAKSLKRPLTTFEDAMMLIHTIEEQKARIDELTIALFDLQTHTYKWVSTKWARLFFIAPKSNAQSLYMISPFQGVAVSEYPEIGCTMYEGRFEEEEEIFISCCTTGEALKEPLHETKDFDAILSKIVHDSISTSAQKKADSIFQTLRLQEDPWIVDEYPALFTSIQRKNKFTNSTKK